MKLLTTLFLRFFGFSLGRSYRNSTEKAWTDAIYQVAGVLGLPFVIIVMLIATPFPWIDDEKLDLLGIFAALVFAFPGISWLERRFGGYRKAPTSADRYRSRRERTLTMMIYFGMIAHGIAALITVGRLQRK